MLITPRVGSPAAALLLAGAVLVIAACNSQPAPQAEGGAMPEAPAVTPVLSVNELMVTMVDNASHVLWDVEVEGQAPKNEADWLEVEDHAVQIAAAGMLIQLGGTGQADPGWARLPPWRTNAHLMMDAALAARQAAKQRDLPALVQANGRLVESCESCHKEFKPSLPTEGILHQRPHSESRK